MSFDFVSLCLLLGFDCYCLYKKLFSIKCVFNLYIKEDVVCLPMRQLSTTDQMTQKLTEVGYRTAFNNEQSPYRIVSYKRSGK